MYIQCISVFYLRDEQWCNQWWLRLPIYLRSSHNFYGQTEGNEFLAEKCLIDIQPAHAPCSNSYTGRTLYTWQWYDVHTRSSEGRTTGAGVCWSWSGRPLWFNVTLIQIYQQYYCGWSIWRGRRIAMIKCITQHGSLHCTRLIMLLIVTAGNLSKNFFQLELQILINFSYDMRFLLILASLNFLPNNSNKRHYAGL